MDTVFRRHGGSRKVDGAKLFVLYRPQDKVHSSLINAVVHFDFLFLGESEVAEGVDLRDCHVRVTPYGSYVLVRVFATGVIIHREFGCT